MQGLFHLHITFLYNTMTYFFFWERLKLRTYEANKNSSSCVSALREIERRYEEEL